MSNAQQGSKLTRAKPGRKPNERLKAQRLKKNWTQVYVATMIGTSDVEVSRWETGAAEPTLYFREQLCELFGTTPEALGFVTAIEAGQQESEHPSSLWNFPYRRNPLFTGREEVLARLHTLLHAGKAIALVQAQAISGLGGIGKTQTAIEYAYRYHADYSIVLWVKADTPASFFSDLAALTQTLKLPEKDIQDQEQSMAAVLRWLREHAHWLLILDNVEDLTLIEPILSLKAGHVLLTTRTQITGTFAQCIDLQQMTVEEGALFLLRRAKRLAPDAPLEQASDMDRERAQEIVRVLDGLPLALDQVGAYLEETASNLSDYLDRYRVRRLALLNRRGGLVTEHPEPVTTTFSLSFEKVASANPAAADLLRFCAFLDADTIPEEIFTEGTAELGHNLEQFVTNPLALDEALATLRTYSLMRRAPETRTLAIHRLVQAVLRDNMVEEEQRRWVERVVRKIAAVVPSSDDVAEGTGWERGRRYYLQVLTAVSLIEQWGVQSIEAERLLHWVGDYFSSLGQYSEAASLLRKALQLGKTLREPEDPMLGEVMNDLALVYLRHAGYNEAESLLQEALRIQAKVSGLESRNGAKYLNNLGHLYLAQGRYKQAEPYLLQAQQIQEKLLGPEDLDLAFSLRNLGWLYFLLRNFVQAVELNKRALRIRERALGAKHLHVAVSLLNLGVIYREQGDYTQAELSLQQALKIFEEMRGAEHPLVGEDLYELAQLRCYQGRYDEAASLFQRSLAILEQRLGTEHPDILEARNGYAALLYQTHHYEAARAVYEKTLERALKGVNRIELAATLEGLGCVVAAEGEPGKAVHLWGAASSLREELGVPMLPLKRADYEHAVAAARTRLGEAAFATAWNEGHSMTPEQALAAIGESLS